MLLALDINSKMVGFCFGGPSDSKPRGGSWRLSGCHDDDRLNRSCGALYTSISEFSKLIHPTIVAIEAPFNPQAKETGETTHQTVINLFRLEAVARAAGQNAGARVIPVHVQSWRKTFCGNGRPENPKQATQERCRLFGWKFENEDEADAIGVWVHGMSLHFPTWAPRATPLFARSA